jgi:hypothetical protein
MDIVVLPCGYQWFLEIIATSHHDITKLITYRDQRYPGSVLSPDSRFSMEIEVGNAGDNRYASTAVPIGRAKAAPKHRVDIGAVWRAEFAFLVR